MNLRSAFITSFAVALASACSASASNDIAPLDEAAERNDLNTLAFRSAQEGVRRGIPYPFCVTQGDIHELDRYLNLISKPDNIRQDALQSHLGLHGREFRADIRTTDHACIHLHSDLSSAQLAQMSGVPAKLWDTKASLTNLEPWKDLSVYLVRDDSQNLPQGKQCTEDNGVATRDSDAACFAFEHTSRAVSGAPPMTTFYFSKEVSSTWLAQLFPKYFSGWACEKAPKTGADGILRYQSGGLGLPTSDCFRFYPSNLTNEQFAVSSPLLCGTSTQTDAANIKDRSVTLNITHGFGDHTNAFGLTGYHLALDLACNDLDHFGGHASVYSPIKGIKLSAGPVINQRHVVDARSMGLVMIEGQKKTGETFVIEMRHLEVESLANAEPRTIVGLGERIGALADQQLFLDRLGSGKHVHIAYLNPRNAHARIAANDRHIESHSPNPPAPDAPYGMPNPNLDPRYQYYWGGMFVNPAYAILDTTGAYTPQEVSVTIDPRASNKN